MYLAKFYEFWKLSHIYYIIIINAFSILLFGIDKNRAIRKEKRIREINFFILSFLGGSVGILIGMVLFKHKLKKKNFYFGIPIIYLINKVVEIMIWINLLKTSI